METTFIKVRLRSGAFVEADRLISGVRKDLSPRISSSLTACKAKRKQAVRDSQAPEFRSNYKSSKSPMDNQPKYQKGDKVWLRIGQPARSCNVTITDVKECNGIFQYKVEQDGESYKNGEWVEQRKLKENN
ncbi:hypothetical protein HYFRA_00004414 [Hymenoscyphus fraxineus]|uniref:Uncharacterized protein n=1 Tax=Hymenoscyphus fraxineus TaxID=746836 RepID=A0A9N9PPD2_9HELO|nr:hypothetical protein HYFRA_00004414 [Hymenoscyphus fraxineus]